MKNNNNKKNQTSLRWLLVLYNSKCIDKTKTHVLFWHLLAQLSSSCSSRACVSQTLLMANQNDRSEESRQHPRRGGNNRRGNGGGGGASSLNNGQKKRPQRGMGVEQLERLRMQEQRNQQMTEMSFGHHHHYPPPPPSPYFYPNPFQHSPDHPIPSVPVMHGPYRVPGGLFGFEPGLIHHNPTHENVVPPAYGSGHGFMDPPPPPPPPYLPYTSKELPSIPIHHLPDPTEYHYKVSLFLKKINLIKYKKKKLDHGLLSKYWSQYF